TSENGVRLSAAVPSASAFTASDSGSGGDADRVAGDTAAVSSGTGSGAAQAASDAVSATATVSVVRRRPRMRPGTADPRSTLRSLGAPPLVALPDRFPD